MQITPRHIASNTVWYIIALTLQKVISFVYFSYLARYLQPEDTGRYFFATSFTFIFAVLTDLGLSAILTREIAKDKESGDRLLSQSVTLKILTSIIIVGIMAIVTPLMVHDARTVSVIIIATAAMLLDGFTLLFYAAIRGFQNLSYESLATVIHQSITMIVGLVLIKLHYPIEIVVFSLLAASLFNVIYSYTIARRKLHFKINLIWDTRTLRLIYSLVLPFALASIITRIYAYIDPILLKMLSDNAAIGFYSIAYKVTFAFQFIPLAFVAALYPAFSYYWQHDKELLYVTFSKSIQYLLIISLPITTAIIALAPVVIPSVYTTAYNPAIIPLQILIAGLPFLFLNFPLGSLLNAGNKPATVTKIIVVGSIIDIILNLLLIKPFGPAGAAMASTGATIIVFVLSLWAVNRLTAFDKKLITTTTIKTILLCAVMAGLIVLLDDFLPWYVNVLPAGVLYLGGAWALKLIAPDDIQSFIRSVNKRAS
jgi:O-antigen/teichoic acid export membrane protein